MATEADVTGVSRLTAIEPSVCYEAALVFAVPAHVAELVLGLRARLRIPAPVEHQLVPHVTVLYLGQAWGSWLRVAKEELEALPLTRITLDLAGVGTFVTDGRVRNLHLRLDHTSGLRDLHARAIAACSRLGWSPSTPYLQDRYLPHISIFDRIDIEPEAISNLAIAVPRLTMDLSDLHVMGKILEPPVV